MHSAAVIVASASLLKLSTIALKLLALISPLLAKLFAVTVRLPSRSIVSLLVNVPSVVIAKITKVIKISKRIAFMGEIIGEDKV